MDNCYNCELHDICIRWRKPALYGVKKELGCDKHFKRSVDAVTGTAKGGLTMRLINPERLIEDKGFFIEDDQGRFMCVVSAQDIRNAPNVRLVPVVYGHWIKHGTGKNAWAECSECHVCGSPKWKVCPVCETKMEVGNGKE